MNLVSLSHTIVPGRPWRQTISLKKRVATFLASAVFAQGIKCAMLENLSTTTKIESTLLAVLGKPKTKPMLRSCQGSCGMGRGWYNPVFFFCPFASWHTLHSSQIRATSVLRRGQKKRSSTSANVLSCPRCPLDPPHSNSRRTNSQIEVAGKHN